MPGRLGNGSSNNLENGSSNNNGYDASSSDDESNDGNIPRRRSTDHMRRHYTQATSGNESETTATNPADRQLWENRHRGRREVLSDQFIAAESSTNTTDQRSTRARQQEVMSEMDYHRGMEDLIQTEDAGWRESDEPAYPPFVSHDPSSQAQELISRIARVQEHPEASAAWEARLQERTRHYQSNGITPSNMNIDQRREYYSILDQVTREIYQEYRL